MPEQKTKNSEENLLAAGNTAQVLRKLKTSTRGLTHREAAFRLKQYGFNEPTKRVEKHIFLQILAKFKEPLVIALLGIAVFSYFFGEKISAILVAVMAFASVIISFIQEYRANKDAEKLIDMVRSTVDVLRENKIMTVKTRDVVPGDIVDLSAGNMVPADIRIIEAKDLFINQASFTGEGFPVEKYAEQQSAESGKDSIADTVALMGSSVVSGMGRAVVLETGANTELGKMSRELQMAEPPTAFDKGVYGFTMLMIKTMVILGLVVFIINAISKGNLVEAFLFSLAVAVGLAPEMLPMEVTINLSRGAIEMSKKEVIVKRLDSIQNFGAMDVLCTDKTGTLTQDQIVLVKHLNALAREDEDVLRFAYVNSYYQTGLHNMLDKAVLNFKHLAVTGYKKIDEIPFDFNRRVMSVIVAMDHSRRIVTKGAPEEIFKRSDRYEVNGKISTLTKPMVKRLIREYDLLSSQGFRVLALAYNTYKADKKTFSADDEYGLIFKGFVAFLDPPKPTVAKTIRDLEDLGITLKILSGDNELVTRKICQEVNLYITGLLTGEQVDKLNDKQLERIIDKVNIFCRLHPLQKARVIKALQAKKHAVGYMGDGINDAPALKAADVGISVNNAVGIAKETADIILLRKSLRVLTDCVTEGRKTFGNIIKYIKMGASSNFGNMFSMTGASLLLPFLPMRPIQILLNNFLYDISQISLPTDKVDQDYLNRPRPWNIDAIKKFMVFIGPVSSLFDYLTYAVMWFVFSANTVAEQAVFNTGWFLESLASQTLVIYIIRTNKIPFIQSWPGKWLMITTLSILLFAFLLVNSPWAGFFGLVALPWQYFAILGVMLVIYLALVQIVKSWFVKKYGNV